MGVPLALYFGFILDMRLCGFWYGYIIAMFIVDVIVSYLVKVSSWEAKFVAEPKSKKAQEMRALLMQKL